MVRVMIPTLLKLPARAVELAVGSTIVIAHLVIASRIERRRALALPARTRTSAAAAE
jgi:hypothetical protein